MSLPFDSSDVGDPIWAAIRNEAQAEVAHEPVLASFLHATILNHARLESALSFHLAGKLATETLSPMLLRELIDDTLGASPEIGEALRRDLEAVRERDPAAAGYSIPFLYFKGFQALQSYRIAHWLWGQGRKLLALSLQSRISQVFGVDIHPAAKLGCGILIDHGSGVVIGETAVVEDNVSLLHEVTLGGTGKEIGDRHPKVRHGVLIGAGAKILGNIEIGAGAKIGAGSVVLDSVPPHTTAAGVPAKVVGRCVTDEPARGMDHRLPESHGDGSGI
jgi:serine O-acetyltransferase